MIKFFIVVFDWKCLQKHNEWWIICLICHVNNEESFLSQKKILVEFRDAFDWEIWSFLEELRSKINPKEKKFCFSSIFLLEQPTPAVAVYSIVSKAVEAAIKSKILFLAEKNFQIEIGKKKILFQFFKFLFSFFYRKFCRSPKRRWICTMETKRDRSDTLLLDNEFASCRRISPVRNFSNRISVEIYRWATENFVPSERKLFSCFPDQRQGTVFFYRNEFDWLNKIGVQRSSFISKEEEEIIRNTISPVGGWDWAASNEEINAGDKVV